MQKLQFLRNATIALVMLVAMTSAALAVDDDDAPSGGDDICAGLAGGAQGLCNAYCNAQNCPAQPEKHSCVVLRANFERQTGLSTFPCDGVVNTATPSSTRTATALPPTRTPTNTPGATGTATATQASATPTEPATSTPTSAATATNTGLPTLTATAVSTATATPVGVPTGTAAAQSCAEVGGGAEFVCETFCVAEQCPSDPHPFCEELRAILTARTGATLFPCEVDPVAGTACTGDCGGDGTVDITDLTQCLLIVFGERDAAGCVGARQDGQPMTVGDMVLAVRHALDGCD